MFLKSYCLLDVLHFDYDVSISGLLATLLTGIPWMNAQLGLDGSDFLDFSEVAPPFGDGSRALVIEIGIGQ